jgi:uncharacterized protein (TIGR02588 family)
MRGATSTEEREPRTGAEWVALVGSCLILGVLATLIVLQMLGRQDPAAPVVAVAGTRDVGALHHVDVVVRNDGDDTAAGVQVTASLEVDGEVAEADQVVDFLAGGEEVDLVFVFADDPADGELQVEVAGFTVP